METARFITSRSRSNLAFAFALLPREKRRSMCSLYAFCREVDDVADDDSVPLAERRRQLTCWREDLRNIAEGKTPQLPVNQELQPVVQRYGLDCGLFEELLTGVESDLDKTRYRTHEELQGYCYRVASVVGLLSIEIFGYRQPACRDYAVKLGLALQYTNILRDVKSDAERNRIYLPEEDLLRFEVTEREILEGRYSERYQALARHFADRGKAFYREAAGLLPVEDYRAMVAAESMGWIYWSLLQRLESHRFDVFRPGLIRVAKWQKAWLLILTGLRAKLGRQPGWYG